LQAIFALKFLQLPARAPFYARSVLLLLVLNLLALTLPSAGGLSHVLFLALLGACGAAAWSAAASGQEDARFYALGYAGAFAGATASGISQSLALGSWPEYCFQFGVAWQGALLALALASRYAKIDPLTGAKSRLAFEERLHTAWHAAARQKSGLAVIMVAVGGLKDYDGRLGRIAGDAVLRDVAGACVSACGDRLDLFARYGDEAFAAIVRHVSRDQADKIALGLRELVARDCPLTVGVGVASNENAISAEALAQQAARRSARAAIARA
jgi:diguanylate cyclase (GGDEF)-like protein